MSSQIPAELRRRVIADAQGRCAYCRSVEELMGVAFEVDHIIPESAGGKAHADNLCLSCPTCNRHKASQLSARDPVSGDKVAFFHPLRQAWADHFAWSSDGTKLIGLTPTGRTTVEALHMNRPPMVQLRGYWVALGLHPPR